MTTMHGRSFLLYVMGTLQGEFPTRQLAIDYALLRFGISPDVVDVRDRIMRDDEEDV